ncbi:unnamed protein product, partial [Callosobruchus maculatus]
VRKAKCFGNYWKSIFCSLVLSIFPQRLGEFLQKSIFKYTGEIFDHHLAPPARRELKYDGSFSLIHSSML